MHGLHILYRGVIRGHDNTQTIVAKVGFLTIYNAILGYYYFYFIARSL